MASVQIRCKRLWFQHKLNWRFKTTGKRCTTHQPNLLTSQSNDIADRPEIPNSVWGLELRLEIDLPCRWTSFLTVIDMLLKQVLKEKQKPVLTTLGKFSQLIKISSPSGAVQSTMITLDIAFFEQTSSMPKLPQRPSCSNEAATCEKNAKVSTVKPSSS